MALVTGPSVDDAAVMSPDRSRVAFVSTRDSYRANIWLLDLTTVGLRKAGHTVRVMETILCVLVSSGYVQCRQSERSWARLPADLHRRATFKLESHLPA